MKSRLAKKIVKHRNIGVKGLKKSPWMYYWYGKMKFSNLNPYWLEKWKRYDDIYSPTKSVDHRIWIAWRMYVWSKPCKKWMQARKRRQDKIREQRRKEYERNAETFYKERQGQV